MSRKAAEYHHHYIIWPSSGQFHLKTSHMETSLCRQDDRSGVSEYVLMRAKSDPVELARQAKAVLSRDPSLKIVDIGQASRLIGSSLTAVDLGGLTAIELAFAILMAVAAAGLMLALGFAERRRNFAILRTIGANLRNSPRFSGVNACW